MILNSKNITCDFNISDLVDFLIDDIANECYAIDYLNNSDDTPFSDESIRDILSQENYKKLLVEIGKELIAQNSI